LFLPFYLTTVLGGEPENIMNELTFQIAEQHDMDAVLSLLKEAALWLREKGIDYWQNWQDPPETMIHWIQEGFEKRQFFLVQRDGELVGCFRMQWEDSAFWGDADDRAGYIHSFTTQRSLAGQGIGKRILEYVERLCRENRKEFLRLDCGTDVLGLRAYYEANGFKVVGEKIIGTYKTTFYEKALV
jgi:GNAT superfamily N-acetyltransferase